MIGRNSISQMHDLGSYGGGAHVKSVHGGPSHRQGNKERISPLWRYTTAALQRLLAVRNPQPQDWMFCSRARAFITRDGIAYILQRYTALAAHASPSLRRSGAVAAGLARAVHTEE
jgi:hypothetical protein